MSQNKAWEREVTPAGKHEYLNIVCVWHLWRRHIVCMYSVHYVLEMIQYMDKHSRWYKLSYETCTSPKVLLAWMRGWARLNRIYMLVTFSTILGTYITNKKGLSRRFFTLVFFSNQLLIWFLASFWIRFQIWGCICYFRDSLYHSVTESHLSLSFTTGIISFPKSFIKKNRESMFRL